MSRLGLSPSVASPYYMNWELEMVDRGAAAVAEKRWQAPGSRW